MQDEVRPDTSIRPERDLHPGITTEMVIQTIETFSDLREIVPTRRSNVVLHETDHAWMVADPLGWEAEMRCQADGWPAGGGGEQLRPIAPAEPDLDAGLCVAGVVAGTAELKDTVFAHRCRRGLIAV